MTDAERVPDRRLKRQIVELPRPRQHGDACAVRTRLLGHEGVRIARLSPERPDRHGVCAPGQAEQVFGSRAALEHAVHPDLLVATPPPGRHGVVDPQGLGHHAPRTRPLRKRPVGSWAGALVPGDVADP
jgi:hypothetical protein